MGFLPAAEQLKRLEAGVEELLPRDEFIERLERSARSGQPLRVKQGFDPTAPDIHLGHTVGLRKLRQFQELGHQVVLIVGDYTSLVGDPSGRSATRPQLTSEEVEANAKTYLDQFFKVVDPNGTQVLRNGDWFARMGMKDVIKLCARYTVARMLERDDFTKRLAANHPISVHELLYPIMQGFDSVMIRCDLELGATEQKFNLLVGRTLQEDYRRGEMPWADAFIPEPVKSVPVPQQGQIVLTLPILVGTDGKQRMSKSLGNYIGVAEPANIMYEKLMRVPDGALADYSRLLLEPGSEAFESIQISLRSAEAQLQGGSKTVGPTLIGAHEKLARALVTYFHDAESAEAARSRYRAHGSGVPEEIRVVELPGSDSEATWIGYLAAKSGLVKSTSEFRKLGASAFSRLSQARAAATSGDEPSIESIMASEENRIWLPIDLELQVPSRKGDAPLYLRKGKRQETTVKIVWG